MSTQPSSVVELESLSKQFRDVTAVDSVDLSIREGELLTLLGPSGCGKTTTLRMIAGFETPTDGLVSINDESVTRVPAYNRDTGMVFQHYALFPHMNVADNIAFGLRMQGAPEDDIRDRVADALEMVRLSGLGDRYPKELSGGQQQRVALARALIIEPSVMLLDEPLSDLDKKLREEMRLEILRLHRELDVTMVYVTHNQEEALTISDRMAVMNEGKIHQVGTPEEVYQEPDNEFVADFIGNADLLGGTVEELGEEAHEIEVAGSTCSIAAESANHVDLSVGDTVTLLFRPERFTIHSADHAVDGPNELAAIVREVTYLGSRVDYFVDVSGTELQVAQQSVTRHGAFEVGDEVTLSFEPDAPFAIPGDRT